jgi:hypothetical protein
VENHLFVPEPSAPFLEVAALALLVGLRWLARRRPRAHAEALAPA